jgi:hypothetical protein
MKKIIKISIITFGVCIIAGKANAQLASDQPAMTIAQIEQLRKAPTTAAKVVTVQTASSLPMPAGAAAGAKAVAINVIVPSQGGVITPKELPVSEIKRAPVSTQIEEKEKKNNR